MKTTNTASNTRCPGVAFLKGFCHSCHQLSELWEALMFGKFGRCFTALLLLVFGFGCNKTLNAGGGASGDVLRVGVAANMPPIIYEQKGKFVGLEADMARKLGKALQMKVVFKAMAWDKLIDELEAGKVDIVMSGMTITKLRQTRVNFSDPYIRSGLLALVPLSEIVKYDHVGLLVGSPTIGVEEGTTADNFVERHCRNATKKSFRSVESAVKSLSKGKLDAVIADASSVWWLAARYESKGLTFQSSPFNEEYLAWAIAKTDTELLEKTNLVLEEWKQSGELDRMLRTWIPETKK